MKNFYTKTEVANIATTTATKAVLEERSKSVRTSALAGVGGLVIGAAITAAGSAAYCRKIRNSSVTAINELKADCRILSAGIVEAKQTNVVTKEAMDTAYKLVISRTDPAKFIELYGRKPEALSESSDNKKKKGGDK